MRRDNILLDLQVVLLRGSVVGATEVLMPARHAQNDISSVLYTSGHIDATLPCPCPCP